ncbi:hypothetical protein pipiens_016913 [Culex pipiens pipiens]|uniref:Uncharacterized protein n=1 Tax=Culex pipiens pipiens TaxID=38569 RepID=A0ABD1CJ28_CULPP
MDDDDFSSISGDSIPGVVDIRVKKTTKARCPPITVRNKSAIEINNLMSRLGGGGGNYSLRNFEKAVQIKAEKASPSPRKFTSNVVAPGLSFANIAAGPGTGSPPGASTDEKEAPNDDLFTVTEFLGLAREMYARLSKCTTREEQFFALHELMVKYIYVH